MNYKDFKEQLDLAFKNYKIKINSFEQIDEYFLCDYGENSIFHYTFKGLSLWKFGLWLEYYENGNIKSYQFFARTKDELDKFKPDRSNIIVEKRFKDTHIAHSYDFQEIINMLTEIKHNKIVSYLKTNDILLFEWGEMNLFRRYIMTRMYLERRKREDRALFCDCKSLTSVPDIKCCEFMINKLCKKKETPASREKECTCEL